MLFAHLGPGVVGQLQVQPRQHHCAPGQAGDHRQEVGVGRRGPGRPCGDHGPRGRPRLPGLRQGAQQPGAALGRIDQPELGQPLGPGLHRDGQEVGRHLPVAGQVALHQAGDTVQPPLARDLLDLQAVQEARQGVGQLKGARRVQRAAEQVLGAGRQARQLEPAAIGVDGRGQVQGQVARFERRLALVEIAERPNLRQQQGPPAAGRHEGFRQGAHAAPRGQQHHGLGQGLVRQGVHEPGRQIGQERPMRRDGEPARRGPGEGPGAAHPSAPASSRASAASRPVGSLT